MAGRADADPGACPSGTEPAGDPPRPSTAPTVVERVVYHDGGPDGEVELAIGYAIPESVSRLAFWIERPSVAVVATDGFERSSVEGYTWQGSVDGPAFEWDGSGDHAAVRLRQPLADGEPATYGAGDGDWALCLRPRTHTRWRYRGREPRIERQAAVRGPGVAGEQFALLGGYDVLERTVDAAGQPGRSPAPVGGVHAPPATGSASGRGDDASSDDAHDAAQAARACADEGAGGRGAGDCSAGDAGVGDGSESDGGAGDGNPGDAGVGDCGTDADAPRRSERIRLVVPDAAEPTAAPGRILDVLADVSERLAVGGRNPIVTAFVAPTADVTWRHRGLSLGPDARVNDAAPLSDPTNVWIHEYVHTRQNRTATTTGTEWLLEATAEYYGLAHALERGAIDFGAYREVLERGIDGDAADAVLADPSTWTADAQYRKGALVVAALDRRIRAATGATFQAVCRAWNQRAPEPFDADAFAAAVEAVGGPAARAAAVSYTQTAATPACWDEVAHAAAFARAPVGADHGVPGAAGLSAEAFGEHTGDAAVDPAAARHR